MFGSPILLFGFATTLRQNRLKSRNKRLFLGLLDTLASKIEGKMAEGFKERGFSYDFAKEVDLSNPTIDQLRTLLKLVVSYCTPSTGQLIWNPTVGELVDWPVGPVK